MSRACYVRIVVWTVGVCLCCWSALSQAAFTTSITTDGTLAGSLGTTIIQVGNVYNINGGQIRGPNVFHSFDIFNLGTRDTASFNGPSGIANILARVTGGQASQIDGTLRSTIPAANLYFLNPSGVVFGPNASMNVSGSLIVSTADYWRFANGAVLFANLQKGGGVLQTAPVVAFGFLSPNPAPIVFQNTRSFQVPSGQTLGVVAGDIQLAGSRLVALGGKVILASVASVGEVIPSLPGQPSALNVDTFSGFGRMSISDSSIFTNSFGINPAGNILIRSGRLVLDNSEIISQNAITVTGVGTSGEISIRASESIDLTSSKISSNTSSVAPAGNISVATNILTVMDSLISAQTNAGGKAGNIAVEVDQLSLLGGAQISASTFGLGQGGTLTIKATDSITIVGNNNEGFPSGLFARTSDRGDAGKLSIISTALAIMDSAVISSGAGPGTVGKAGDITVQVERLSLTGRAQISSSTDGTGGGGDIQVRAGSVILADSATISAKSSSNGRAGNISIRAGDSFSSRNGSVTTEALQSDGGNIEIQAGRLLQMSNGAVISAKSSGPANAGSINISATDSFVMRDSKVTTEALQADGGNITLKAGKLIHLTNSAVTSSVGNTEIKTTQGGNITIDPDLVVLKNSQILANAFAGTGGNIKIVAGLLLMDPASVIDASSTLGVSGTVTIESAISDLSGSLVPLPQNFLNAGALLASRCAARVAGNSSSFVVAGRDGIPTEPGGLLPSPVSPTGAIGVASATHAPHPGVSGVEPGTLLALNTWGQDLNSGCVQ